MTNTYKYDVFISYARKDGLKHAEALEAKLESAGYKTWRDKRQLDPHQDFTGMIEDAIENSRVIVGCITPDVRRHDSFVRRELQFGMIDNKPIVPLLLNQSAKLPIHIVNLTYIDFTMPATQWDAPFKQLDSRLTDIKGGKWDSDALTPPEDSFREYCEALYKQIAKFLNQTVFSMLPAQSTDALITLKTDDSPDMVLEPMMQEANALPLQFFGMAGIELDDETPPFTDFAGAFKHYEGRVLLLGDPGSGKTTTLFAYARDAISRRLDDPTAPLPILLPTIAWNSDHRPSLIEWVQSAIPAFKNKQAEIETLLNTGKALLLLDGLDELGDRREKKQGNQVIETYDPRPLFINTMLTDANNQIVISCRVKDYNDIIADNAKIPLNGAITLQPLDDSQLQTYLRDLPQLWDALQNDDDLRDVARTPLLLSLFSFTFADILKHEESTDLLDDLSTLEGGALRDRLFRAYIECRYTHQARKYTMRDEQPPFTVEQVYEVLGHVAMVDACNIWAENRILFRYFDKAPIEKTQLDDFINFIIALHLLLNEKQSYRFVHLLLRDHLVYEYCIPRLDERDLYPRFGANPAEALGNIGDVWAVESLIAQLQDRDKRVRKNVVEALGNIGDKRAVHPLMTHLTDEDVRIRRRIARALGKIGDIQVVESLITQLSDQDSGVQRNITDGLIKMGEGAVQALIIHLTDENTLVRRSVISILERIRDERTIEPVMACLGDEDAEVRIRVAKMLGTFGDARAIKPLLAQLGDEDAKVRAKIADTLRGFGDAQIVEPLISQLQIEDDPDVRRNVIRALGELGDTYVVESLLPMLQDEDDWVRGSVASALGKIGDVRAVDPLIPLLQDENPMVRRSVVFALGIIRDVRAVEPLIPLLHEDEYLREVVAMTLVQLGDSRMVDPLIAQLDAKDVEVRQIVVKVLGKLGDVRAVDPLIPMLQDENDWVRSSVASALGEIGDVRAVESLIPLFQDSDGEVQKSAAEALLKIGESGLDFLIAHLKDENAHVRLILVWILGEIGNVQAVEWLIPLLNDQTKDFSDKVNEYVREALQKIGTPEALQAIKDAEEAGWFDD